MHPPDKYSVPYALSSCQLLLYRTLGVPLSIIRKQYPLPLINCLKMHRAPPQHVDMLQGLLSINHVEFIAFVQVLDIEFAIAPVVAVVYNEVGAAEVGHAGNDAIAHLLPVFLDDYPFIALFLIQIEVEIFNQVFGKVVAQERDIVLHFAYLENLLQSLFLFGRVVPALLDILEDLEAYVVRIEVGARG